MKQIIQSFKTGETILEDIPAPKVSRNTVLIRTTRTLVSLGTERMLVEFGKASLIEKARQQPDKVKMVLDKIRSEGLMPTLEAVFNKLEQPLPLGYCNVGRVIEVGESVKEFKAGDRVVSNGAHAEIVCVPQNLVAKIPDEVSDDEAAFTVIGSIGLQGIRLCNPTLGETIVVVGLGLIGMITAQLLRANGCRVIGVDIDDRKLAIAKEKGIYTINPASEDVVKSVEQLTGGIGADGVIITASAKTDEIISQAARMSRKRGRIILVGVIGLKLSRTEFYEKELTFQVSCSYGPGRYDDNYEQKGQDYPLSFVRWTEKRNFEAILQTIQQQQLDVASLITEQVPLEEYTRIYSNMSNSGAIASILVYQDNDKAPDHTVHIGSAPFAKSKGIIGVIGAGNFTKMTMLPALKGSGAGFKYISSASGVSGTALAKKHGFTHSTTDNSQILNDPEVDLVMITTRHHVHAAMVVDALQAGKNVFVEKPLAITTGQLNEVLGAYTAVKNSSKPLSLTVGFNRRFSPHIQKMKSLLGNSPMNIIATMNAGFIPPQVWVHDMQTGGGRIIGEACHFIDLITFLTGSRVVQVCMNAMGTQPMENTDNATILLKYENGSTGVINYFANGSKAYSKERVEVYSQERTLVMDNYRVTRGFGFGNFSKLKTRMDKGHKAQFGLLVKRIQEGGPALIPFDEIINTTAAAIAAVQSLKAGAWVKVEA